MTCDDYASRMYGALKARESQARAMGRKAFEQGRVDAINEQCTKAEEAGASGKQLRNLSQAMGGKKTMYLPHQGKREMQRRARRAARQD